MDEERFNNWLSTQYGENTVRSRISNCHRVEEFEGNLDEHFQNNQGRGLIQKLTYTTEDKNKHRAQRHRVPINGDVYNGTATLKQAVNLYFKYKSGGVLGEQNHQEGRPNRRPIKRANRRTTLTPWPVWGNPSDEELHSVIMLTAKYIKFLDPEIIDCLVKDNQKNIEEWSNKLKDKGINPQIYLWDKSPCAFPGVRRHSGRTEIANFRGQRQLAEVSITNAVKLDDNDFPKQIWAFMFTSREFRPSGPIGYSLAHLVDHKEKNNRLVKEFDLNPDMEQLPFFGLYTCPTNTAYIPTNLIRPTDFSPIIRHLLFLRAKELYGETCNLLPPRFGDRVYPDQKWVLNDFEWANPVGNLNNMQLFIDYREEKMNSLLAY